MWYKRKGSVVNKLLVNKVEKKVEIVAYIIFIKKNDFFANLHGNIKL